MVSECEYLRAAGNLAWLRRPPPTPSLSVPPLTLSNNVAPGFIDTPLTNNPQAGSLLAMASQPPFTPMARAGRPEEIADVIAFMLSEEASFVNGATWNIDGGFLG